LTISTAGSRRQSRAIKRQQAANILNAVNLAEKKGTPLNTSVCLNLARTNCPLEDVSQRFSKLRDNYFGPWIRRPSKKLGDGGFQASFAWTIENINECHHIHWLVHIPKHRRAAFEKKLPLWLARVSGGITCDSAIKVTNAPTPPGAAKYMCKGIDPAWAQIYGIRPSDQGVVFGKRSGVSLNLGQTERRRCVAAGLVMPLRRVFGLPRPSPEHLGYLRS
jgi:hypothetical protein